MVISSNPSPARQASGRGQSGVTGYTVVLPPGWSRIPVRRGTEEAVARIVDDAFPQASRDRLPGRRRELRQQLTDLASRAREGSGLDLYLPTRAGETTLACSFVVAEVNLAGSEQPEPAAVLARLFARREHCGPVTVPAGVGARTDRVAPADAAPGVGHASRRVDYVLPVPQDPDRWVTVSFSTLGAGDPTDEFAELQVELFDALMTTFRWTSS